MRLVIEIEPSTDHGLARLVIEAVKAGCDSVDTLARLLDQRVSSMSTVWVKDGTLEIRYAGSTNPNDRLLLVKEVA
jgi:hypothetical protein